MINLLRDTYDLHIHCAPDVVERSVTGLEMTKRAVESEMKGFALKAHYGSTAQQAAVLRNIYPECNVVGAITLNAVVGGINPIAVENAARQGAKIVWCPTFDSPGQQSYYLKNYPNYMSLHKKLSEKNIPVPTFSVLDEEGKISRAMQNVLEIVMDYNMVLGTGHISHKECFALAEETHRRGFKKLLVTHADWSFTKYTLEEQIRLIELGASIEHSYTSATEEQSWMVFSDTLRKTGIEHVVLSTDLGQKRNEFPDVGFRKYAEILMENGFSLPELKQMMADKPAELVET